MFEIQINDRAEMTKLYAALGITDSTVVNKITRLTDRKKKISPETYQEELAAILGDPTLVSQVTAMIETEGGANAITSGLQELGIRNVKLDRTIARGFNYYTGMVFEVIDTHPENNRSMMGGGRYDNLTSMFGGDPICGVGFGMGDVTMRDFLETHNLLPKHIMNTAPTLMVIPAENSNNLDGEKIAQQFRSRGIKTAVDIGNKKLGKKIADAAQRGVIYALVLGETEITTGEYVLKNLEFNTVESGTIETLLTSLLAKT
jgi:histidyl-tRNA synthetase